ncbi:hypothetical protein AURDEDRAFT_172868 [Auricularia subglabra TFB-10046 SS5]|uniref:Uncharacterized protein n=1 Tax=Auricularia subglabra (strain TFB-10046 / SS5) TaxID=717982 RepID=J0WVH0_AURST|nr:hypothetical protein AURDEDRAFT_172868 [Auricularia subglabra TFB-10046 SS5]
MNLTRDDWVYILVHAAVDDPFSYKPNITTTTPPSMQNSDYDYDSACRRIDDLYSAAEKHKNSSSLFPQQFMDHVACNKIHPACHPFGDPKTHRLIEAPPEGDEVDINSPEYEFRLIGIVEQLDIPPFERRLFHASRIRFLQQRIGVAPPTAEKFAANGAALFRALELSSTLAPHHVDHSNIGSACPTFGNRLFSAKDYTHEQDVLAITNTIDPSGELAKAAALAHLVHTSENTVEYLRTNGTD